MQRGTTIFLDEQHPVSGRHVIFQLDGHSGWLYLSGSGEQAPEKDAFVFSTGEMVSLEEALSAAQAGIPPALVREYASEQAVIADAHADEFFFWWSSDGESVALMRQGEPLAMIDAESEHGYSKALGLSGFYGMPWQQEHYESRFGVALL